MCGGRFDAAVRMAAHGHNSEDSSPGAVSAVPQRSAGSCTSWGAMVCEAGLRMRCALCSQSDPTHPQFHPDHRANGRRAGDRSEHQTPETICSSGCSRGMSEWIALPCLRNPFESSDRPLSCLTTGGLSAGLLSVKFYLPSGCLVLTETVGLIAVARARSCCPSSRCS
jgi:hypothetical protein